MSLFPITLSDVVVSKKQKTLLGPVSLKLNADKVTMIIGPNGAGKTTLLRTVHGLEKVRKGNLSFAQKDRQKVFRSQCFVFQKPIMLQRSALDNVMYPLTLHGTPKLEARKLAVAAIERVGLVDSMETRAPFLSGGEAQKLAIARALVTQPELLILDEPTASLDSGSIRDIENLIKEAAESGVQILMTTHDMGQARRLAHRVIFLNQGRLVENTEASSFWQKPQTLEAQSFINGEIV